MLQFCCHFSYSNVGQRNASSRQCNGQTGQMNATSKQGNTRRPKLVVSEIVLHNAFSGYCSINIFANVISLCKSKRLER